MTINRIASLILGGLVFSAGCGNWDLGAKYERNLELQHALSPSSKLEVTTSSGSINVQGHLSEECRVLAHINVRADSEARAQEIAEQIEIVIQPTATGLEIRAEKPRIKRVSISISYDLAVPKQTTVVCRSSSGSLKVIGIEGNVDARTSSGSVRGEHLSGRQAILHTSSGSIRLDHADVTTADLHTSSGSVRCYDLNCPDIKARVSSGSITVVCRENNSTELTADLSTRSGGINLSVPRDYRGLVELSTWSGSVNTELPVTDQEKRSRRRLVGTIGTGSGHIRLKTSSGSVRLNTL